MGTPGQLSVLIVVAYLLGSIPFGLLVGWLKGIDPRKAGSGNIGASNLGRLLGTRYFWLVFSLDLLKGLLPTLAAAWVLHRTSPASHDLLSTTLWLAVAAAAVLGHMFSLFLKFKGGKGVATSAGVVLGVYPYFTLVGIVCIAIFLVVLRIWRYISLASIVGAVAFPVLYVAMGLALGWPVLGAQLPLGVAAILLATMIVYKHRTNIARLRAGTENRVGTRPGVVHPGAATGPGVARGE